MTTQREYPLDRQPAGAGRPPKPQRLSGSDDQSRFPERYVLAGSQQQVARLSGRVQGFDVAAVAAMDESAIDTLAADTRIIRNRRKIVATVHNAQRLIELEEEYGGDIRNYLRSHADFYAVLKDVHKQFKYMGDTGTYYWLYVLGEEVPDYGEFCNRGK